MRQQEIERLRNAAQRSGRGIAAGRASALDELREDAESKRPESEGGLLARFAAFRERHIRVLEQLAAGASPTRTFEAVVQMIQEQSPGTIASVLVLDADGIHLRHGAAPDLPPEYCRAIDGVAIGPVAGSCGTAAFRGERVIVSDIATDPLWENFKGLALGHGLLSCWSEPILCSQGKVLGTFAMYHRYISMPTEEDLQSIRVAAHLAGIAIERESAEKSRLAAERERELAERESIARERIAAAVRESEERYTLAEEATKDGIWDWNPTTGVNYISPQWKALLGFENEELPNEETSFFSRIHPDEAALVRESVRLHLDENRPYCVELRLRCKDGSHRWFESRGEAIRDEAGKVLRMVGAMSDITRRKQADRRLAIQHEVTRVLSDSPSLEDAVRRIMQAICGGLGWDMGAIWEVCPSENLVRCVDLWHAPDCELGEFPAITRQITFAPDVGMPGRVWRSGEPLWIPDVAKDPNFPRAPYAARAGLHAAFGFPIRCDSEVLGVLEAFSHEIQEPDDELLQMMDGIGSQIGQFIERRQAEEELARSEQKYRQLFESSRDAIMTLFPPEWKFTKANAATIKLFGVKDEQEFIALGPWDLSPERQPDGGLSSDKAQQAIAIAMERGSHFFEWIHRRIDGAAFPATVMLTRVELEGRTGLQATVRDITERKRAEEELNLLSNRLLLATRAASIGIWDFDPVNNVLIWDDQMFRVYGVPREKFSAAFEAWQATVHPEDLPREMEKVRMALQGEQEFDSEFRVIWPDKSIHHIKANASVFWDASGKAARMIGTNWDITAQKRAEEELARTVAELARSNADLAQFASVASHDLQEPLRAVAGCVELLQRRYGDKLDAQAAEWMQLTVEGAKRMQTLIRDLLAYSRVGTRGKSFERTDASTALDLALANLATAIRESGAVITHDPLPSLVADPTQMAQLFQNLIGNALKFCKERSPEIHVGAQRGKEGWTLSVRDNGIGIEPQYRERIFVIFQRLHTRAEYPGTGIGLAICHRIVERHSGRIWVESEPGKGSTFYFTIPQNADLGA